MSGGDKTITEGAPSQYVKLNVGGTLHNTTICTLTKYDSMLCAMFSGKMETPRDSEGWIVIDRCGKHFGTILNFLRDGSVPLPESSSEIEELLAEAKYYLIQELVECCESTLQRRKPGVNVEAFCRVVLITSAEEGELLIKSSPKPVVKLSIYYYSYQLHSNSDSDVNLFKNMELFFKLSLRFSGRILFVKDSTINYEICGWLFYFHGSRVAAVSCISNAANRNKQVDFPDGRIYEEMMNLVERMHQRQ